MKINTEPENQGDQLTTKKCVLCLRCKKHKYIIKIHITADFKAMRFEC